MPRLKLLLVGTLTTLVFLFPVNAAAQSWTEASSMTNARENHTATRLQDGKVLVVGGHSIGDYLRSAELYDPLTDEWIPTGSLQTGRSGHAATLLSDGKVLVTGGYNGISSLNSAEVYDPATEEWTVVASMQYSQSGHKAVYLVDGRVLVFGMNGLAELYDPGSDTWSVTGSLSTGRVYCTATRLSDGRVLVAGGYAYPTGQFSSAEIYDPSTGNWTAAASMHSPREEHSATLLSDGRVLVAGGYYNDGQEHNLSSTEVYDPGSDTWEIGGNLNDDRQGHTATPLSDGKILVTGGYSYTWPSYTVTSEIYNSATGIWSETANMITGRRHHTATLLDNGNVLITGGDSFGLLSSCELFGPASAWTETGSMANGRSRHAATLLPNGNVLVTGGYDGNNYLSKAELYNPFKGTWTAAGEMTQWRITHTATLLRDGKVLVAGWYSSDLYDPATGEWTATGSMNQSEGRYATATLLEDGKVLLVGGYNGSDYYSDVVELYDPVTETWTLTGALNTGRSYHAATLLTNGQVLVTGGSDENGDLNSAELYDPVVGTWSIAAPMSKHRSDHTATLLRDGRVLVVGVDYTDGTVELYDPDTDVWSLTGALRTARSNHTATLLPNGNVLIAGGWGNRDHVITTLNSAEFYDPATGVWTETTGKLTSDRISFTATLLPNGKVLLAGGYYRDGDFYYLKGAELYDPAVETWGFTGSMAAARKDHTLTLLPNGDILAVGGDLGGTAERYDSETGAWGATVSMNSSRAGHTATLLGNGNVLVAGGDGFGSAELYDIAGATWTTTDTMNTPRSGHTATLLADGKVLVSGGFDGSSYLLSAQVYDPTTNTWTDTGSMQTARSFHTATLMHDGRVLVAGGYNLDPVGNAEIYNPLTGLWSQTAVPLNYERFRHTATLLPGGQVLVVGGSFREPSSPSALTVGEIYDPVEDSWTVTDATDTGRYNHTATLMQSGHVLVVGGWRYDGKPLSSCEIYDPATGNWRLAMAYLNTGREGHTAVLLANSDLMVAGGFNDSGDLSSAEIYNPGLGFEQDWRPVIDTVPSPLEVGAPIQITGSNFRGNIEGSSGNTVNSATNYPLVQLFRFDSGQSRMLVKAPDQDFTDIEYTGLPLADYPDGHVLATVFRNGIPSASKTILVKNPPQVLSVQRSDSNPTNAASLDFTVTFSKAVLGVSLDDFALSLGGSLTGGVILNISPEAAGYNDVYTVTVGEYAGDGILRLDIVDHDDSIVDYLATPLGGTGLHNGDNTSGESYDIDIIPPQVAYILCSDANPTRSDTVHFTVAFTEDVTGVDTSDFSLIESGTITSSMISNVTGSADVYTVTATGYNGNGTLRLDLADDNSIQDALGTPLAGDTGDDGSFVGLAYNIDMVAPSVVSIEPNDQNPTNATSVTFNVTFSESVTGVGLNDFNLPVANTVTGGNIANVTGGSDVYTVTVDNYSGEGTLGVDVVDDGSIQDALGNALSGPYQSPENNKYRIDMNPPFVTGIVRENPTTSSTNAASVNFTVSFNEAVIGVDTSDFVLVKTVTDGFVTGVSGSGSTYTVTVSGYSGTGTLRLDVEDDNSILDALSVNSLGGTGEDDGDFTSGESYDLDLVSPAVISIERADLTPTNATSVNFNVNFSESVSGVDAVDFAVTRTGALTGGTVTIIEDNGSSYVVQVSGYSNAGTLRLDLNDDDSIQDDVGNTLGGSGFGNGNFTAGQTYSIDLIGPQVTAITRADLNPTNATSVDFIVVFSEAVQGVDVTDFILTKTVGEGTVAAVNGTGSSYTVTVNNYTGAGTLRLDLTDNDSIVDLAGSGNPLAGGQTADGSYTNGEVYNIDLVAPTVSSIVRTDGNPTNAASIDFTVTFSESVLGVDTGDFALTQSTTGGAVSHVTGSGTTYFVTVSSYAGVGTLRLDVIDDDSITDVLGIALGGSGIVNGDYTAGETYTIDRIDPSVTSILVSDSDPLGDEAVDFFVTFNENVTGVDATDFTLVSTGTLSGATIAYVDGTGSHYTVTVNGYTGQGTLRLDVIDDDSIADDLGNYLGGQGAGDGDYTDGEVYTLDLILPTVSSITRLDPNPTDATSVRFTVSFSESVTGVGVNDFVLPISNTITGGSVTSVTGSGTNYTITVGNYSGEGTLKLDVVDDNTIVDAATNPLGGTGVGDGDYSSGETYNIDVRSDSTISCSLTDNDMNLVDTLILGQPLKISGQIVDAPQQDGAFVSIALIPPTGNEMLISVNANAQGAFDYDVECRDFDQAGVWTVRTSWAGDEGLKPAVSDNVTLTVTKAAARVTLDVTSQAIKHGEPVSISGKFTPNPDCGGDLTGIPLTIFISGPEGTDVQEVQTDTIYGQFALQNYTGFDVLGDWTVQVFFYGSSAYANAISNIIQVRVVENAGYAIVVQGKFVSEEGLESHNKTTNFVYNKLKGRGLLDADIQYFNYDTNQPGVDGLPTKSAIEDAIKTWALNKMNAHPANLYVVLVDHGLNDQFYIHPAVITSQELDDWLTYLQANLSFQAANQEIISILGFCRSGSFIDDLSGINRVTIASAAYGESSYKGPLDEDLIREGEYFVSEFFKQVAYGKSVKQCFEEATALTEAFTSSGTGLSSNSPYFDDSLQHPLLDDNGDGVGSNNLSDPSGDGQFSEDLFIGVSALTGNDPGDVQVVERSNAQFIAIGASTANLWARVDDGSRLRTIWVEVKPPGYDPVNQGGSGQAELQLPKVLYSSYNAGQDRYEWTGLSGFDLPGAYQVFFFAKDDDTGNVSHLVQTTVYKATDNNQPPADFVLLAPADGASILTEAMLLDWTDSSDPDGDEVTYTVFLSQDAAFTDPIAIVKENITNSACVVNRETDGLEDLTHYYWKVWAIDEYGAYAESAVREFDTDFINAIPGWLEGHVYNATVGGAVANAQLTIGTTQLTTDATGYFLCILLPNTYSAFVSATGFDGKTLDITVLEGGVVTKDIGLDLEIADALGDIDRDGQVLIADAILALQVAAGVAPSGVYLDNDVNGDGKIGMEDFIFILQKVALLR